MSIQLAEKDLNQWRRSTYENRNEYRDMLLGSENIENFISGVIMFDETFRQSTTCSDKIPFTLS